MPGIVAGLQVPRQRDALGLRSWTHAPQRLGGPGSHLAATGGVGVVEAPAGRAGRKASRCSIPSSLPSEHLRPRAALVKAVFRKYKS